MKSLIAITLATILSTSAYSQQESRLLSAWVSNVKTNYAGLEYVEAANEPPELNLDEVARTVWLKSFNQNTSTVYRALSPIVHHSIQVVRNKETGQLEMQNILVARGGLAATSNEVRDHFISLQPNGELNIFDLQDLKDEKKFRVHKYMHDSGSLLQQVYFPRDFIQQPRNAVVFHPANTFLDSILEEKFGTNKVPGLPDEAKKYEGKTNISILYGIDPATYYKGRVLGYLVDIYTPSAMLINGQKLHIWAKRYYGNEPDIPKTIVVRPFQIQTPDLETMEKIDSDIFFVPLVDLLTETDKNGNLVTNAFPLLGYSPSWDFGKNCSQIAKSLQYYRSLVAITPSGSRVSNVRLHRFDEPVRILGYNWGWVYVNSQKGSGVLIKME